MQFKPEAIQLIKSGLKTQTRRPVKAGETLCDGMFSLGHAFVDAHVSNHRLPIIKWEAGKLYSLCPGRGKEGVGFIRLTDIRQERLTSISESDVRAEGFDNIEAFFGAWKAMYPKSHLDDLVWVLDFDRK